MPRFKLERVVKISELLVVNSLRIESQLVVTHCNDKGQACRQSAALNNAEEYNMKSIKTDLNGLIVSRADLSIVSGLSVKELRC